MRPKIPERLEVRVVKSLVDGEAVGGVEYQQAFEEVNGLLGCSREEDGVGFLSGGEGGDDNAVG